MSEYTEKADQFLKEHGLEFRTVLVGDDCPTFCEDAAKEVDMDKLNTFPRKSHIHGKHYRCTISGAGRGHVSFDFWNSYADEEYNALGSKEYQYGESVFKYRVKITDEKGRLKNVNRTKTPNAYDLLASITKYAPGTFENFCSDYGYDPDSRKAEDVYRAVVKEYVKVSKFFTDAELEQLQDIQ